MQPVFGSASTRLGTPKGQIGCGSTSQRGELCTHYPTSMSINVLLCKIGERSWDGDDSGSSFNEPREPSDTSSASITSVEISAAQKGIDLLFDRAREKSEWMPSQPPEVLGELLDSRYMLPFVLPSDPRLLAAFPGPLPDREKEKRYSAQLDADGRSASRASIGARGTMAWKLRSKKVREVRLELLRWVDGLHAAERYSRQATVREATEDDGDVAAEGEGDDVENDLKHEGSPPLTRLARKASTKSRGQRASHDDLSDEAE